MIELRPTLPADLPPLSALFESRFGHPLAAAEWRWKYEQIPGEGRSWVAVDEAGTVLAHAGALALPCRWRRGEAPIWQLSDWVGSPRRRGLRPALVDLGRELLADLPRPGEAPWIFGFPSARHFRLGQRVFGYGPLAPLVERAGPLPEASPLPGAVEQPELVEISDHCGDWAEAVWEACGVYGVRRGAAFLNWRYHARPERYYRFYRLCRSGVDGLAVFAFAGSEARATELWLPPGPDWRGALRPVAVDLAASGLSSWRFWPPPPGRGYWLEGYGLEAAGEIFAGYRGRLEEPDPRSETADFFYAMGDYDLV